MKGSFRFIIALTLFLCLCAGARAQDAATKVNVQPAKVTLRAGETGAQLTAAVTPETASQAVTWTSSKSQIASVDAAGYVTPLKPGKAYIYARTAEGKRDFCTVTVKAVKVTGVTTSPNPIKVAPNGRVQLTPVLTPAHATNQKVTYKSANSKIATVTSGGLVRGVKLGSTFITCYAQNGAVRSRVPVEVCFAQSNIYYAAFAQVNYTAYSRLAQSLEDARLFEKTLLASDFGEISKKGQVYANLTGDQIKSTLSGLPAKYGITKNDITYLYYSGHGASSDAKATRGALVGVGGKGDFVYVDEVKRLLDAIPGTVVVVLDSCLSGQYIQAKGQAGAAESRAKANAFSQGVVETFMQPGVTAKGIASLVDRSPKAKYKILVACRPLQSSYVDEDGSFFTNFLCEAAGVTQAQTQSSMPGDTNANGYLSVKEAYKYAYPRIKAKIAEYYDPILDGITQDMMVWPSGDTFPVLARIR